MSNVVNRDELWAMAHAERAALADDLADLNDSQWARQSLCGRWTVEQVLAHLTAAASIGRLRWLISVVGARFDFDRHNARQLAEHRGATPAETLDRFRAIIPSTTSPSGHTPAWLGEVVVHAQDIRRPLGLPREPSIEAVTAVARFYASRDFTVSSRSTIEGLRLEATDGPFAAGTGSLVSGPTLAFRGEGGILPRPAGLFQPHSTHHASLRFAAHPEDIPPSHGVRPGRSSGIGWPAGFPTPMDLS